MEDRKGRERVSRKHGRSCHFNPPALAGPISTAETIHDPGMMDCFPQGPPSRKRTPSHNKVSLRPVEPTATGWLTIDAVAGLPGGCKGFLDNSWSPVENVRTGAPHDFTRREVAGGLAARSRGTRGRGLVPVLTDGWG